jgi:hypothetical protein
MNRTNIEHAFYGLLMQLAAWPFLGPWAGVWIALAYFWSREVAQRELYLKHFHGADSLDKLKPFEGWRAWEWVLDSQLDVAVPFFAALAVAVADSWLIALLTAAVCGLLAYWDAVFRLLDKDMEGY